MKIVFYTLLQDHRRVLHSNLLKNNKFKDVIWINGFASKLVYIFYIPFLLLCVNFIKIGQVVWLYRQFEVSNNRFYLFILGTIKKC